MGPTSHNFGPNRRVARRRRGWIAMHSACAAALLTGCSLVEQTSTLVAGLGDGLRPGMSSEHAGREAFEVGPHGDRRPVAIEARSLEDYERRIVSAYAPAGDAAGSHQVTWNLAALPPPNISGSGLESRIAPAAGTPAKTASRAGPRHPEAALGPRRPTTEQASPSPLPDERPPGKSVAIVFDPRESALSERDKARLSMLAWPHLDDQAATVRIRAFLPPPSPGIGPAPVVEMDRGRNVRDYLAHLGVAAARTSLSLVEAADPSAGPHRVEVEILGRAADAPQTATTGDLRAEGDRERASTLKAFHERLKTFTRERPEPARLREAPAESPSGSPAEDLPAPMPKVERGPDLPESRSIAVQLASLPDRAAAEAERARLARHLAGLLDGLDLGLQEVELPGRGRYHRIRTAPLGSESAADQLCRQLKAEGQDCLVVTNSVSTQQQLAGRDG